MRRMLGKPTQSWVKETHEIHHSRKKHEAQIKQGTLEGEEIQNNGHIHEANAGDIPLDWSQGLWSEHK